jgi:hypothetical protein
MNAGDVKAGRPSSEESWLTTPSTDPNAALWASITPPPSPTLTTAIRRRLATLAPDLLAQRLHLAFPQYLSSRMAAGRALLGAAAALGAGMGLAAYVVAGSFLGSAPEEANATAARSGATVNAGVELAAAADQPAPVIEPVTGGTAEPRAAQTPQPDQAFANTAAMAPEQLVQALQPSDALDDQPRSKGGKVKKRAHAKKRVKSRAKSRASRSATLDAEALAPERASAPQRAGAPQRAKPRRQATFKFN